MYKVVLRVLPGLMGVRSSSSVVRHSRTHAGNAQVPDLTFSEMRFLQKDNTPQEHRHQDPIGQDPRADATDVEDSRKKRKKKDRSKRDHGRTEADEIADYFAANRKHTPSQHAHVQAPSSVIHSTPRHRAPEQVTWNPGPRIHLETSVVSMDILGPDQETDNEDSTERHVDGLEEENKDPHATSQSCKSGTDNRRSYQLHEASKHTANGNFPGLLSGSRTTRQTQDNMTSNIMTGPTESCRMNHTHDKESTKPSREPIASIGPAVERPDDATYPRGHNDASTRIEKTSAGQPQGITSSPLGKLLRKCNGIKPEEFRAVGTPLANDVKESMSEPGPRHTYHMPQVTLPAPYIYTHQNGIVYDDSERWVETVVPAALEAGEATSYEHAWVDETGFHETEINDAFLLNEYYGDEDIFQYEITRDEHDADGAFGTSERVGVHEYDTTKAHSAEANTLDEFADFWRPNKLY